MVGRKLEYHVNTDKCINLLTYPHVSHTMTKRKDHEPISDNAPYAKRYRSFDGGVDDDIPRIQPSVQPRVNPTYGQRGAFPGLDDDPDDEKVFYGPASDGLEYLQMVRYVFSVFVFLLQRTTG